MSNSSIGKKLTLCRKKQNISIKDLSKLIKVTPSLISQIEKGSVNPSINFLKSISNALNVPLITFFVPSIDDSELIVKNNLRKIVIFPESENILYEMLSNNPFNKFEFAIMNLSPKSYCKEKNGHAGDEVAYILKGSVELSLEDDIFELNEGDSVKIPFGMRHKWGNPSEVESKVIYIVVS
ncbi:helix-turn-helix domain-containing protein [Clostridioides sp. ES-S-0145-01]|uniref:helix-turn-helix domain-containing protein n=1 Tax=Clostridioides sp. ES-S-0145-01 TaxID=2770784 RepID=UPI001D12D947|nr:helix-turn-helix domain-containing protein [Clostridioides sp. ES-S-0145-01]